VRKGLSTDPLTLTSPRHGHFRLESGHHSNLWLDLEGLFVRPAPVRRFVTRLARALRPHRVAGVCGPLVGGAFLAQMVATALKAEFFFTERVMPGEGDGLYQAQYHLPRAARSQVRDKRLAIVDDAMRGVPVEAVSRVPFDLWVPAECPLCASGKALADP
jgi:orotate phosphoribosyltransferase